MKITGENMVEKITMEDAIKALEAEDRDFQRWYNRMNERMDKLHQKMGDDLGCHKTQLHSDGGGLSD